MDEHGGQIKARRQQTHGIDEPNIHQRVLTMREDCTVHRPERRPQTRPTEKYDRADKPSKKQQDQCHTVKPKWFA